MARQSIELRNAPGSQRVKHPGRLAAEHTRNVCEPDTPSEVVVRAITNQLSLPFPPNYRTTRAAVALAEGTGTVVGFGEVIARRLNR